MNKSFRFLLFFLLLISPFVWTSCSEDEDETVDEYANWQVRNDEYFTNVRSQAQAAIRQAKNQYGATWRDHCKWRTYLSYSLDSTMTYTAKDSIYVEILKQGTGSGCPQSTDSVSVYYMGRIIPTDSYSEGYVFSHSGQSTKYDVVFDETISLPAFFRPNTLVKGLGTAVMKMHIGDTWRVYIPYPLGYDKQEKDGIPPYSTLIFDIKLKAYYKAGAYIPTSY